MQLTSCWQSAIRFRVITCNVTRLFSAFFVCFFDRGYVYVYICYVIPTRVISVSGHSAEGIPRLYFSYSTPANINKRSIFLKREGVVVEGMEQSVRFTTQNRSLKTDGKHWLTRTHTQKFNRQSMLWEFMKEMMMFAFVLLHPCFLNQSYCPQLYRYHLSRLYHSAFSVSPDITLCG